MKPRQIPPDLHPQLLRMRGEGKSATEMAAWLAQSPRNVKVTPRAINLMLARQTRERKQIAHEKTVEHVSKTVTADLDAIDELLAAAVMHQKSAEELGEIEKELHHIAFSRPGKLVDEKGATIPLDKLPDEVQASIAGVDIEELKVAGVADDGEFAQVAGRVVKVRYWDKPKALVDLAKIKSGHMAMQAMQMQVKLLALRLELSGAGGDPENDTTSARARLLAKFDTEAAGA